jgi:heme exporter protein C
LTKNWWKILAAIFVIYTIIAGFILPVPRLPILHETIRNLYFHVPMWFGMIALFGTSLFYSIKYLRNQNEIDDLKTLEYVNTGILFGVCGLITGSIWAKNTWGSWWVIADPKLNGAAIVMLEYFAYIILRGSIQDEKAKAKVSAVYNIFAAASIIPLIFILPRMSDSLHPGNGGNPGFNTYDLDSHMRMVFYPAVIGWAGLGFWLASLRIRLKKIENAVLENQ